MWQSAIPFTHGEVSYTYRFSRYVLDLLRMGNTIKDVALHLHVGWNMVKDIHKRYLKSMYSHPDIRHVRRLFSPLGHPRFQVFPLMRSHSTRCSSLIPKITLLDKDDFGET